MSLKTWLNNIWKPLAEELDTTLADDALIVINDGIALAKLRRIEAGENAEGNKFSEYTSTYAKYRLNKGRQAAFKSYEFTGAMSRSIQPEIIEQTKDAVTVSVRVNGDDNVKKLRGGIRNEIKKGASARAANPIAFSGFEIITMQNNFVELRRERIAKGLK